MNLAIFDLDNTLIIGQSQLYLLYYAVRHGKVKILSALRIFLWFVAYKIHLVKDPNSVILYSYERILAGQKIEEIDEFLENFFDEVLKKKIDFKVLSLLKKHQDHNDKVVLLTNALYPLARIIAKRLNIDIFFATEPEVVNNVYSGRLKGKIVYGEEKVFIINKNFLAKDIYSSYVYADHCSDLPLMKLSGHATAVRPDKLLLKYALNNNWEVIY